MVFNVTVDVVDVEVFEWAGSNRPLSMEELTCE